MTTNIHINDQDIMRITPLGAGNEVGRSAVLVTFKGKSVLFDCGIHPAYSGIASLPFFDETDPSTIDLVLVSHFHLDHCGAVPYFLEKTDFKGRMFMTHPTKAIFKLILSDFVKVSDVAPDEMLFGEQDLANSLEKIECLDYHQELEHKGIKFWCYNAGHVLGAAMFMIEIAGVRVLYTGDFSRQSDRHLLGAETPMVTPDVLIVESTYGIQVHEPRKERELRFTKMVHEVVKRGGRCLLPVFALGRAQELLLILDEYWESHPELQQYPIYYASSLAKKSMSVFQTYINMMNDKIKKQFEISNPFKFKHISSLKSIQDFEDLGPCVIMASPGMLQSGLSRQLFEMWCSDKRNGVIIPGYCVEGTLAKKIMTEPQEVTLSSGQIVPLRLTVKTISFSAHSDRQQTEEFIAATKPTHIVLVHGDPTNVSRLKQALIEKFGAKDKTFRVHSPKNIETIEILFQGVKIAKVIGDLANVKPELNQSVHVSGVLVHKDFQHNLMAAHDLKKIADIPCTGVKQRLMIPLSVTANDKMPQQFNGEQYLKLLSKQLQSVELNLVPRNKEEDAVKQEVKGETEQNQDLLFQYTIAKQIVMTIDPNEPQEACIEWISSASNDIIVDAVCNLLLDDEYIANTDSDDEDDGKLEARLLYTIQQILKESFSNVTVNVSKKQLYVQLKDEKQPEKQTSVVLASTGQILECSDDALRSRLEIMMKRILLAVFPMPTMMGCLDECDHHQEHDEHVEEQQQQEPTEVIDAMQE